MGTRHGREVTELGLTAGWRLPTPLRSFPARLRMPKAAVRRLVPRVKSIDLRMHGPWSYMSILGYAGVPGAPLND